MTTIKIFCSRPSLGLPLHWKCAGASKVWPEDREWLQSSGPLLQWPLSHGDREPTLSVNTGARTWEHCYHTMTVTVLIILYTAATGYLIFWASLWIVHLMAIIYGWVDKTTPDSRGLTILGTSTLIKKADSCVVGDQNGFALVTFSTLPHCLRNQLWIIHQKDTWMSTEESLSSNTICLFFDPKTVLSTNVSDGNRFVE